MKATANDGSEMNADDGRTGGGESWNAPSRSASRSRRPDPSHSREVASLPGSGFADKLLARMVVPAFVIDAHGRALIWNKACERLTGIPAAEVIGTSDHWRGFTTRHGRAWRIWWRADARPTLRNCIRSIASPTQETAVCSRRTGV